MVGLGLRSHRPSRSDMELRGPSRKTPLATPQRFLLAERENFRNYIRTLYGMPVFRFHVRLAEGLES